MPSPTGGQVSTSTTLLRVVLLVDGERVDIAVNPDARLADVLHSAGIDAAASVVSTPAGRQVDVEAPLADEVTDGTMLSVVRATPAAAQGARVAQADRPSRYRRVPPGAARWSVCALGMALAAVVVANHVVMILSAAQYPTQVAIGMPVLLAVAGVVLAVRRPHLTRREGPARAGAAGRSRTGAVGTASTGRMRQRTVKHDGVGAGSAAAPGPYGALAETVLAPALGFAAGFLVAEPGQHGALRLAVVLGLLSAAVLAVLRFAVSRREQDPSDGVAAVVAGVSTAVAALFAVELLLALPPYVAPALMLGAAPLIIRAMPGVALDISEEQVLDMPFLARTAMSVRGVLPRSPGRVRREHVAGRVRQAEQRERAGMIAASVLVTAAAPVVLASYEPGGLRGWGTIALVGLVVVFLTLAPRSFRRTADKIPPRLALFTVLAQLALGVHQVPEMLTWGLVLLAVSVAFAYLAVPIARGYRSVRFSRIGDIVEGLAVGLALPAALVAAGAVQGLQTVTGG